MPIGQAILAQAAGPQRMGRVMSVIGVPTLLGPILGPVIGGLIVDNFSWRWIFFVNLPVGVVALALAARILPRGRARRRARRLDVVGLLLLSPGLALLVYGLSEFGMQRRARHDGACVGLVGGALLLVAVRAARARATHALIDISLFRDRAFAAASGTVVHLRRVAVRGDADPAALLPGGARGERAVGGPAAGAAGGGGGDGDADRRAADRPARGGAGGAVRGRDRAAWAPPSTRS